MRFWYLVTRAVVTGTFLDRVAIVAARAGIHGSDELEIGWKCERSLGAADRNQLIFDRLAHHFQHARAELGQLVLKEHAAVRQADLAGLGPVAAAHQTGVADGVVRGAEGAGGDQWRFGGKLVGDRVDADDVQGFVDRQARQDAGQGARQQGLVGA